MSAIAEAARSFIGTPWRHQGRLPGVGLDCLGLIVCAALKAGYEVRDNTTYSRQPNPKQLLAALRDHCTQLEGIDVCVPGDIILFNVDKFPRHVGIVSEVTDNHISFIHSFMRGRFDGSDGEVVEVLLDSFWRKRIHSVWRITS